MGGMYHCDFFQDREQGRTGRHQIQNAMSYEWPSSHEHAGGVVIPYL